MDKELLSITDENSILITAEFLESGQILKVGDRKVQRFELDLIVNSNITCDQLLEAIQSGLRSRLLEKYHFDVENDDTYILYTDSRHPESETVADAVDSEEKINEALKGTYKISFFEKRKIRKALKKQRKFLDSQKTENLEENDKFAGIDKKKTTEEKIRDGYIICWNSFQECYEAYNEAFKKHVGPTELQRIKFGTPREPVIGLGSVDYNKLPYGRFLYESDIFKICLRKELGHFTLRELGFITTSRLVFDPVGWHHSGALFDPSSMNAAFKDQAPLYNISERPLRRLDDKAIHIIPPTDAPEKNKQNLIVTILTPLLMTGVMIGIRLFSGNGNMASLGLMTGCMGIVTVIAAVINTHIRNKEFKEKVETWRNQYQLYVQHLLEDIQNKQNDDIAKLHELYPPARQIKEQGMTANDLVSRALAIDGDIFSRGPEHPDFLAVRVGVSAENSELVPSIFDIVGEKKEAVFASIKYHNIQNINGYPFGIILPNENISEKEDGSTGYLIDLPANISKMYAYLKNAPVLLHLLECETLGIVINQGEDLQPFLSNLLLNLCFYQSPDDLQIVMFCKECDDWITQQEVIRRYKHLPHFRELLGDLSAFAFNKEDAYLIFNKLLEILSERKAGKAGTKYPHIVVIVQEEYEIKRHPVSEYLPSFSEKGDKEYAGISFIFCKRYMEELPKYCGQIIKKETNNNGSKWFLLPHKQVITRSSSATSLSDESRYEFVPDEFPPVNKDRGNEEDNDRYYRAFKSLSALYYERIAQGADVPTNVDLIDLLESNGEYKFDSKISLNDQLKEYIFNAWGIKQEKNQVCIVPQSDITSSLAVPIGLKAGGIVNLDLHEKSDGPHMLVAGTTGSGKTETVLTFLINLCTFYTPEQVNLLLMDMKGAGFVQRIGQDDNKLPHVVGTVTDISGDETGTGTAYMLKRFLHSMTAEVKRRKIILNKMDVDNVDAYSKARRDLDAHIANHTKLKGLKSTLEKLPPLPHLFLVIDEFTELMRFSSENGDVDFKEAITSLARIGRSLGFHIILISQNIENAITPDIRVNSRARLCLKVATREASMQMIETDLAASPLMPGNGRAYLLVGTGSRFEYFQSGYSGADITRQVDAPIVITCAETSGKYSLFYDSKAEKKRQIQKKKEAIAKLQKQTSSEVATDYEDHEAVSNLKQDFDVQNKTTEISDKTFRVEENSMSTVAKSVKAKKDIKPSMNHENSNKAEVDNVNEKAGITQLKALVTQIRENDEFCRNHGLWEKPHCVFQQPLPKGCFYDYDWGNGSGTCVFLESINNKEQRGEV